MYVSKLVRFERVCSNVDDFNKRNFILLLGCWCHRVGGDFLNFATGARSWLLNMVLG